MAQFNSPCLPVGPTVPSVRSSRCGAPLLVVMILGLLAGTTAAVSVDYSQYLHWTSVVPGDGVGSYRDATLAGDRLYAARLDGGVQILSLSDPARPRVLGDAVLPGETYEIAVAGDIAFVAAGTAGLQVLDCGDPTTPQPLGSLDLPGPANGVILDGSTAYVCCADAGLAVVDVSDPAHPVAGSVVDTPGFAAKAALMDGYVAVADGLGGVQFVSLATLSIVGSAATPGLAMAVAVTGSTVLVADYVAGLTVIDADPIDAPQVIGSLFSAPGVFDVVVRDGLALLAGSNAGLVTVDVSDPAAPTRISGLSASGTGYGIALGADHVYLSATDDLHTYALGDGDTAPILDYVELNAPRDAAADTHYLYAVDQARLWVINIGTGEAVGVGATFFDPRELLFSESYAYVADGGAGLRTTDLTDPLHPEVAAGLYVGGEAWSVARDGDRLLVAVGGLGLVVLDLSADPGAPALEGLCATGGDPRDVAAVGGMAYLATLDGGLWSVDIGDPSDPVVLDDLYTGHAIHHVAVSGDRVYAIDDTQLLVFDASDPADLSLASTYTLRGPLRDLEAVGDVVYVVDPYIGLYVIDVSDPAAPVVVGGGISSSYFIRAVTPADDRLYVVDGEGVFVMPLHGDPTGVADPPRARPGLAVAPNPFNPRTTITFALAEPGEARVDVYDLLGRRVTVLADRRFEAGAHALSWDGRDAAGRAAPTGVYVARLRTTAGERSEKMTLLR